LLKIEDSISRHKHYNNPYTTRMANKIKGNIRTRVEETLENSVNCARKTVLDSEFTKRCQNRDVIQHLGDNKNEFNDHSRDIKIRLRLKDKLQAKKGIELQQKIKEFEILAEEFMKKNTAVQNGTIGKHSDE
jgi:hypothetical protein